MITTSIVLYKTPRNQIEAVLKSVFDSNCVDKIYIVDNSPTDELSYVKDYIPYAVEFNTDNMKTATLPGTTPDMKETNNVSIFLVDKIETEKLIQSMFYSDLTETETENENTNSISNNTVSTNSKTSSKIEIELLNGSGDKTKLEKAKKLLENAGYDVEKTGNTTSISKTIITNKKDVTDEKLKDIKETLGVGSISTNKSSTSLVDVTIVIGKDF